MPYGNPGFSMYAMQRRTERYLTDSYLSHQEALRILDVRKDDGHLKDQNKSRV
jgi:hypothetical protein